jgi:hypothetical protein
VHRLDGVAYDVFALNIGSDILSRIYPENYNPDAPQRWYAEVNGVLVDVARRIFAHLNCSRAVIGWELLVFEEHLLKSTTTLVEEDGVLQWRPARTCEVKHESAASGSARSLPAVHTSEVDFRQSVGQKLQVRSIV